MPTLSTDRHVPMRTCIGTGIKKPKNELMRLVLLVDGEVKVDLSGKLRGRGANLDMSVEAFDAAIRKKAINRALKLTNPLTSEQIATLRAEFIEALAERQFRKDNKSVTIRIQRTDLPELD